MKDNLLDEIASHSLYLDGVAKDTMLYCCKIFCENMVHGSVLELGPAEGLMTDQIYKNEAYFQEWSQGNEYTIVEGSKIFADSLRGRYPKIEVVNSYFEDYSTEKKFDNIILGHVLEHVDDPVYILQLCRQWLSDAGKIFAAVPNANSLHRQAAVKMGILKSIYDFSEKDHLHGHQRVFDMDELTNVFVKGKLWIERKGGYWLKPLSDAQINASWDEKMIHAFLELGEQYPEIAGEIYIIAMKNEP